jgi:hypothetical protein
MLLQTIRGTSCPHCVKSCYKPEEVPAVPIASNVATNHEVPTVPVASRVATNRKRYQLSPLGQVLLPTRSGNSCAHHITRCCKPDMIPNLSIAPIVASNQKLYQLSPLLQHHLMLSGSVCCWAIFRIFIARLWFWERHKLCNTPVEVQIS